MVGIWTPVKLMRILPDSACRCTCGHCIVMPTSRECVCCAEIEEVTERMQEGPHEVTCITEHEGFEPVCLNVWVLQAAYFQYRHTMVMMLKMSDDKT